MKEACENCPKGRLLDHYAKEESALEWSQELTIRALNRTTWRDNFNGRRKKIKDMIESNDRLLTGYYGVLLPDALVDEIERCNGPFERTTDAVDTTERAAKWVEKICGAEVAVQLDVSGMRVDPVQNL
jgi:hypothetical protein